MSDADARREDYWTAVESDGGDDQDPDDDRATTVRDRIMEQMDPDDVHGLAVTARTATATYAVVAVSTSNRGGDVLDLRTVIVDDDGTVKIGDNGLWVPRDADVATELTQTLARATTDLSGDSDPMPARLGSAVDDVDAEELVTREVADDYEREDSDDDYTEGPPPEIGGLIDRLDDAGISTDDRFNRLQFGGKEPFDHEGVGRDGLYGNYGVYARADDPLVLVDVDDPDELDAELPETYAVSSPHGTDERAHHFYRVEGYDRLGEVFGSLNYQPTWGDVRTANQYVVGPGSQLDGCDKDYCDECATPTGGTYDVVEGAEIASVDAEWLIDLLDDDPNVTRANGGDQA